MLSLPLVAAAATIATASPPPPSTPAPVVVKVPHAVVEGGKLTLSGAGPRARYADVLSAARRPHGALVVVRVPAADPRRDSVALRLSQPRWDARKRQARFTAQPESSTAGTALAHLDARLDDRLDTTAGRAVLTVAPPVGSTTGWHTCATKLTNTLTVDLTISSQQDGTSTWAVPPPASVGAGQTVSWASKSAYDRGCQVTTTVASSAPFPVATATMHFARAWGGNTVQLDCAADQGGPLTCVEPPTTTDQGGPDKQTTANYTVGVVAP